MILGKCQVIENKVKCNQYGRKYINKCNNSANVDNKTKSRVDKNTQFGTVVKKMSMRVFLAAKEYVNK